MLAQFDNIDLRARARANVGYQAILTFAGVERDNRLTDVFVLHECNFDLAGFNTKSTNFDLRVGSPTEFVAAISAVPREVACAVH